MMHFLREIALCGLVFGIVAVALKGSGGSPVAPLRVTGGGVTLLIVLCFLTAFLVGTMFNLGDFRTY